MRARILLAAAAALAAIVGLAPSTAAASATGPPGSYYLSLGDSLAFGYQNARFQTELLKGTYSAASFPGYTYRFGESLQELNPSLQIVDYGCPGERTTTFLNGGCPTPHFLLHNTYAGPQMDAALAFLDAHEGEVNPITVSLGANDVQACKPAFTVLCVGTAIATVSANLTEILAELRLHAPDAEIIVLLYYDPYYVVLGAQADTLAQGLNAGIAAAVGASGSDALEANAFALFNTSTPKRPATDEYTNICRLTLMCTPPPPTINSDIHPSNVGYVTLAQIFRRASGY